MNIPVTTILASLLATVFLVLSLRVIRLRMEKKVAHGDGVRATFVSPSCLSRRLIETAVAKSRKAGNSDEQGRHQC